MKKSILLLGHDDQQHSALSIILRLAGYKVHVVSDEYEAINLVEAMPETVHSLVLSGTGCQVTLRRCLLELGKRRLGVPILLVAAAAHLSELRELASTVADQLKLVCCASDRILELLGSRDATNIQLGHSATDCNSAHWRRP